MEGAQRGARAGCSGTVDNLLIDRTVTLDCHRRRRNLSVTWIDVKKAYDSVDHGWLSDMKVLHRFPAWLSAIVEKLSKSWNTSYLMWTQHWPLTELRKIDREARKIIVENGGKHPCGSTSILYLPREKRGRGLRSVEQEYQVTKVKAAVKLYRNDDQAMKMVRKLEERADELGHQSLVKDAAKCAEKFRIQLKLKDPEPTCLSAEIGDVITAKKLKVELKAGLVSKLQKEVHSQKPGRGRFCL